jgi:hypothetical protein
MSEKETLKTEVSWRVAGYELADMTGGAKVSSTRKQRDRAKIGMMPDEWFAAVQLLLLR